MSHSDITALPNPRPDRRYEVTLSTDRPLRVGSATLDGMERATITLVYTPGEQCVETRSFGRYLTHLLEARECNQALLRQILADLQSACRPLSAEVQAGLTAADGRRYDLSAKTSACQAPT